MDIEKLEKAKKLQKDIEEYNKAIEELEGNDGVFVVCENFDRYYVGDSFATKIASIDKDLKEYIINYFKNKKSMLEKELEEL